MTQAWVAMDPPSASAVADPAPTIWPRPERRRGAALALGLVATLFVVQSRLLREPDLGFVEIDANFDLRQLLEVAVIGIAALGAAWLVPTTRPRLTAPFVLFAIYMTWLAATTLWSVSPSLTAMRVVEFAAVTLLLYVFIDAYDDPLDGLLALALVWIGLAIFTLLAAAAIWRPPDLYEATRSTTDGFVAAFVIGALVGRHRSPGSVIALLACMVVALAFYRSIGSMVAACAAAAMACGILAGEWMVGRRRVAIVIGLLLFVFAAATAMPLADELVGLLGRALGRDFGSLESLTGRTDIWAVVVPGLLSDAKLLWFGAGHVAGDRVLVFDWLRDAVQATLDTGEHDFGLATHTHNLVLGAVANTGLVGLVLVLTLYAVVSPVALARGGRSQDLACLVICLTFMAVNGISENLLSHANLLATGTLAFSLAAAGRRALPRGDQLAAARW
jgi:O-antigen ligase